MDEQPLKIALLGNLSADAWWSTEWEYEHAYKACGHRVDGYLEQEPADWDHLIEAINSPHPPDLVHWTRTKSFADRAGEAKQLRLLLACTKRNIPIIGVHLDRWEGLERGREVFDDPYFSGVDMLFTADGDADDLWAAADVNHRWLLPAIGERWLRLGTPKPEYDCDVVFVGGWDGYGHKGWKHRAELINHLSDWYGDRFLALPRRGQPRIVGRDLNDVYASAKIAVGDSCLVPHRDGTPKARYCSDRIPESLGRGAVLAHPHVDGIDRAFGRYLPWDLGDWDALRETIDVAIADAPDHIWSGGSKLAYRQANVDFIAEAHTYNRRAKTILDTLSEEGML